MDAIDKEISSLEMERKSLVRKRRSLFEILDISFTVRHRFSQRSGMPYTWKCQFYIEFSGKEEILYEGNCYFDERIADIYLNKIPEKYQKQFEMVWSMAHEEVVEEYEKYKEIIEEKNREQNDMLDNIQRFQDFAKLDKSEYYMKKFHRDLVKIYHPDNKETGDNEAMQCLNELKILCGI